MAKTFTNDDAKKMIDYYTWLLTSLKNSEIHGIEKQDSIKKAANAFVAQEVLNVLRSVPIDELNRDKRGIRIKPLMEANLTSMADLYSRSIYKISSIRGISQDTAYAIKRIVNDFAEQTRKEIKIKLSIDNKNKYSSALVKSVSIYKNSLPHINQSLQLLSKHGSYIQEQINCLKLGATSFRWFFSSKSSKEKAINAYYYLSNLLNDPFHTEARNALTSLFDIENTTDRKAWLDFAANNVQFYNILETTNPGLLGTDDALYGLPESLALEIQDQCFFPDGLKCTLRRYQEWGVKYILHQERVLLGDEMGLGKTIQAIATMVSLKNIGATHFIVVCPASVVTNWCREITKHSLLHVIKIHGNDKHHAIKAWITSGGVAVTTYETTAHFNLDPFFRFSLLVVDEAHYIKNPNAKRTLNTKELSNHTNRLLFMTGTALENRVEEMVELISILQPRIIPKIKNLAFMSHAPQFREKVAPVYYRRKREDVLTELPELIESKEWCSMTYEEERIYEQAAFAKQFHEMRRISWNIDNLNYSSKANRLKEIVETAELEGRKVLVFSFFLDTIHKIYLLFGNKCLNPITGSVSPQRRQEIIDEFDKAPAGTVLVSQILSGGTGLNIQSASVVVICEPQLKPSIENQAISRAYRMGQSRNVLVYRLLCENSIDERITDILEQKQATFNAFADKSVAAQESLEIDNKTIGNLIEEEIRRIREKRENSVSQNHAN